MEKQAPSISSRIPIQKISSLLPRSPGPLVPPPLEPMDPMILQFFPARTPARTDDHRSGVGMRPPALGTQFCSREGLLEQKMFQEALPGTKNVPATASIFIRKTMVLRPEGLLGTKNVPRGPPRNKKCSRRPSPEQKMFQGTPLA